MPNDVRRMVLHRAAEIAGGAGELRSRLGVESHALELWLSGRATPPESVFLLAVDLILQDDVARAAQDRRTIPRVEGDATPEPAAPRS